MISQMNKDTTVLKDLIWQINRMLCNYRIHNKKNQPPFRLKKVKKEEKENPQKRTRVARILVKKVRWLQADKLIIVHLVF